MWYEPSLALLSLRAQLRGIKPITREPWCVDEKIYNEDTTRDTTDDERGREPPPTQEFAPPDLP